MFGVPVNELLWLIAAILAGGVVTGLLAGIFGIGGGAVIVPVLYEVFRVLGVPDEVRMQLCIGTSLAVIIPTTLGSYRAHRRRARDVPGVVRQWTVPACVGVAAGGAIAAYAPSNLFKVAFFLFASSMAAKLLLGRDHWQLGSELPGRGLMTVYGFVVGFVASLVGISGGSISTIVLTSYGKPIHASIATSAGLGVPITIVGALAYMLAGLPHQSAMPPLSIGFVCFIGVALIAPVSTYTASYGVRIAHGMRKRTLEIAFGIFLVVMALRFIAGALL